MNFHQHEWQGRTRTRQELCPLTAKEGAGHRTHRNLDPVNKEQFGLPALTEPRPDAATRTKGDVERYSRQKQTDLGLVRELVGREGSCQLPPGQQPRSEEQNFILTGKVRQVS